MKKVLSLVLAVLMVAGAIAAFASCGKKEETKTLKLGFDAEYPPYGYLDTETNTYKGFDLDFAKEVCKEIGYKLELIPIDWDAKDLELNSGNIDCIWSGFTIQGREDDYEWTVAYSDSSIVVLTKAGSGINAIADLAGKIVTVQKESSGQNALDEKADLVATFKNAKYELCADYTAAFNDLTAGAVDAVVIDIGVANSLVEGKTGYVILSEALAVEQYGVGFKKGNTELCKLVSDAMVKLADKAYEIAKVYGLEDSIKIAK